MKKLLVSLLFSCTIATVVMAMEKNDSLNLSAINYQDSDFDSDFDNQTEILNSQAFADNQADETVIFQPVQLPTINVTSMGYVCGSCLGIFPFKKTALMHASEHIPNNRATYDNEPIAYCAYQYCGHAMPKTDLELHTIQHLQLEKIEQAKKNSLLCCNTPHANIFKLIRHITHKHTGKFACIENDKIAKLCYPCAALGCQTTECTTLVLLEKHLKEKHTLK